jgi:DNA (cytosine-5)-methyltransferase 1
MTRPVLLDLFCGAGGAAMGYHWAGFDIVGVDISPQPNYPFGFVLGDALVIGAQLLSTDTFAAVHASPPCQAYSRARVLNRSLHPELIDPTRDLLAEWGGPWVIENVEGAPLRNPVTLCGTEFDRRIACRDGVKRELRRHRLFESSIPLVGAGGCDHQHPAISVFGHHGPRNTAGRGNSYGGPVTERRSAMGISWMNRDEMSQAIPPAFTHHVGAQLLAELGLEVVA